MDGRALFLVALGGAIGAMVRYLTTTMLPLEPHWSTLTINLVGSLLLGIIAGGMHSSGAISDELLLLLGTGILGAFTTMSTFSMDLMQLLEDSQLAAAAAYLTSTALIGPLLAYVGWKGTSMVLGA
mgnify:FL=1